MGKITAKGSRRSYTGATFGGGSQTATVDAIKKARLKKERKARAEKRAAIDAIIKRLRASEKFAKKKVKQAEKSCLAAGSQLRDALKAAMSGSKN